MTIAAADFRWMSQLDKSDLIDHKGHEIRIVYYGDPAEPVNVALECEDCGLVLADIDRSE